MNRSSKKYQLTIAITAFLIALTAASAITVPDPLNTNNDATNTDTPMTQPSTTPQQNLSTGDDPETLSEGDEIRVEREILTVTNNNEDDGELTLTPENENGTAILNYRELPGDRCIYRRAKGIDPDDIDTL